MRLPRTRLLGIYLLAFAVRLTWLLAVQHPLDAIYSDMAGYVDRAERLLWNIPMGEPRILTIYPWGAHALYALEFCLVGRHGRVPIAIAHALVGAVPAPCMAVLAVRIFPSRAAGVLVGVLVALWVPQIAFAGFFLSEIWYSAAIAAQAALTSRPFRRAWYGLGVSVVSAVAFVVRPQFIVTWAADVAMHAFEGLRRGGLRPAARRTLCLMVPMLLMIGGSALRLHKLTGHWGLISGNDEMTRIWAETDICELQSNWTTPDGEHWGYWFSPPSKPVQKPSDVVTFEGYIADPQILRGIREEHTRGVPWRARLARRIHNVGLLYLWNLPWPESNYKDLPWRLALQRGFATAILYVVTPLAAVGIALGSKGHALFIAAANLVTSIACAAFFFGEGRYHVPYDPFAVVLAVVGAGELLRRLARIQLLGLPRKPAPSDAPIAARSAGS